MTKGEKFQEIFPEAQIEYGESDIYIWLNHEPVKFSREVWESNYSEIPNNSKLEKNSKKLEKDFGELDCISRADAIQAMQDKAKKLTNEDTINGLCGAVAILFELPSVTPQEPKIGHWIRITNGAMKEKYICSECGRQVENDGIESLLPIKYPYCHCGAKMVEPQESEDI